MEKGKQINWNELLERAKKEDHRALNELCEKLSEKVWGILQYRLCERLEKERKDVLQNILKTFVERLPDIDSNPQKYVLVIMRNKVGDLLRAPDTRRKVRLDCDRSQDSNRGGISEERIQEALKDTSDFVADVEAKDLQEHMRKAIMKMRKFCRMILLALLEEKYLVDVWEEYKKVEPELKWTAFKARVRRCQQKLKQRLGPIL